MKKEMLINVMQPEECRIAIVEDGVLEELYVERTSHESYVGNIYKGRIVNIEPSIQAAFVDFGVGRNGFLHVSDVEPAYYRHLEQRGGGERGRDRGRDGDRDRGRRGGGGRGRDGDRGRDNDRGRGRGRSSPRVQQPVDEVYDWELPDADLDAKPAETPAVEPIETDPVDIVAPPRDDSGDAPESEAPERRDSPARGRSRRRRRDEPAEGAASAEPDSEPQPRPDDDSDPPRPRLMDSAERRTEDEGHKTEALESISDDDLFFARDPEPEPPAHVADVAPVAPTPTPPPPAAPTRTIVVTPPAQVRERERERQRESVPPPDIADEAPPEWGELPADEPPMRPVVERMVAEFEDAQEPVSPDDWDDEPSPGNEREAPSRDELDDDMEMAEQRFSDFDDEPAPRRDPRPGGGRPDRDRGRRGPGRPGMGRPGGGRPGMGRPKPLIQDIFKRGQEVLVQVIKEGIGTKGPTLSTYISIAGRYLVLMPGLNRVGVSRKIADDDQRRRLRDIFHELQPPKGLGFIIRTAGLDKTKKELQRDLAYLSRLWQVVVRRIKKIKAPAEVYQESDMITRTIRDTFTNDIENIWVDEPSAFEHAQEFLSIVMPRYASRIKHFADPEPLFHKYGIENEIIRIQQRHVPLPMGGSIVIDQTEALVAIDVNSGNFRADNNAEETAYQMNLQAAREIARQLRLRDLGGVIVNDFIDMRDDKHRRAVEKALRDAVKRDRARTKILKISQFGLIEMTRQRIRPSLKRSVYQDCPHCRSTGQVKTTESMSIDVMRLLQLAAHREGIQRVEIRVAEEVSHYLLNKKRKDIAKLEEAGEIVVAVNGRPGVSPEALEFLCYDKNNNEMKFVAFEETREPRGRRR